ncbi:MAG: hypothetical protein JWP32_571, partial [Schumannella sp.]|nr:hypothetical protein [Schumannella sp.]
MATSPAAPAATAALVLRDVAK